VREQKNIDALMICKLLSQMSLQDIEQYYTKYQLGLKPSFMISLNHAILDAEIY